MARECLWGASALPIALRDFRPRHNLVQHLEKTLISRLGPGLHEAVIAPRDGAWSTQAGAVGGGFHDLAGVRAVEHEPVVPVLALDAVVAIAGVPAERVVAFAAERRVGALIPWGLVVQAKRDIANKGRPRRGMDWPRSVVFSWRAGRFVALFSYWGVGSQRGRMWT